jgi:hypothetical protein
VRQRLHADEVRQAEKLVEALGQAEMGEALAQAPSAAVLFRPMHPRRNQRCEIELGSKRNVDLDLRQRGRHRR